MSDDAQHLIEALNLTAAYFTTPVVHGQTLSDFIKQVQQASPDDAWAPADSGWNFHRLIDTVHKVAETMAYAHARGAIHPVRSPSVRCHRPSRRCVCGPWPTSPKIDLPTPESWRLSWLEGAKDRQQASALLDDAERLREGTREIERAAKQSRRDAERLASFIEPHEVSDIKEEVWEFEDAADKLEFEAAQRRVRHVHSSIRHGPAPVALTVDAPSPAKSPASTPTSASTGCADWRAMCRTGVPTGSPSQ